MADDKAHGFVEGLVAGIHDAREDKIEKDHKREEAYKRANEETKSE